MFNLKVTFEAIEPVIDNVIRRLRRGDRTARQRLREASEAIQAEMSEPGLAPNYPLVFSTDRQRRAYFATDAFTLPLGEPRPKRYRNQHIPYERTEELQNSWLVEEYGDTGYVTGSTSPYAEYVHGDIAGQVDQQAMYYDRWKPFYQVVAKAVWQLPKTVRELLRDIMSHD